MSFLEHLFLPHESNNQRAKLLHPSTLGLIIGLFTIFQISLGYFSKQYPQVLGFASQISPEEIIRLTNEKRQSQGLSPVILNSQLSAAAAQKAADMFARNYWAHVSPIGTQPWYFITQAGYSYRYAGENLARDFSDSKSVVEAWIASPSHRENLLNGHYQDIGVAVVDGTLEGRETTLVVQMFGTKLSAAPSVGSVSTSIVKPVQAAAEVIPQVPPAPTKVSPFSITKIASISLLLIFIIVLVIDVITIQRRKTVRWTSKSFAHLIFLAALLISALIISRGQII